MTGDSAASALDLAVAALASRPWLAAMGVEIVLAEAGRAVLRLPMEKPGDAVDPAHGGFDRGIVMVLGDAAGWLCVVGGVVDRRNVRTLGITCDLVAATSVPAMLTADATVVRRGRSLSVVHSKVMAADTSGARQPIGLVQATYAL